MMKTEIIRADHPIALCHAVDVLQHGGMVAFPTDTVYGLAALPFREETIEQLFTAKGRNSAKAIAILVGNIDHLNRVALDVSPQARLLMDRYWPGPLTMILSKHPSLPEMLSQNQTIGVRMPDHPVALMLLQKIGPLAVTSANLSGSENTRTAQEVQAQLGGRIHLIIDGGLAQGGVPSTVVDCTTPAVTLLRVGPISLEDIQKVLA